MKISLKSAAATGLCTVAMATGMLGFTPANAYTAYVSNEKDDTISIIDTETLEVTGTIKVGQRPRGIILTKDEKYILVCASDDDTVEVIDRATKKIVKTLPSGPDPELFILHPDRQPAVHRQ